MRKKIGIPSIISESNIIADTVIRFVYETPSKKNEYA